VALRKEVGAALQKLGNSRKCVVKKEAWRKGRKEMDLSVRPLRRHLLHFAASLRPRLSSSDPNKNSPFAHAFGRRNQFPVRSRVRPSKAPPRSPSLGSVATICRHQTPQTSPTLPTTPFRGPPAPPAPSLAACQSLCRENLSCPVRNSR
jgi:hypothetical protein